MRRRLVLALAVLGCNDHSPVADPYKCISAGGEACFELPSDVLYAVNGDGAPVAPILGCGPRAVETSPSPFTA
jgi:hypothetical protein